MKIYFEVKDQNIFGFLVHLPLKIISLLAITHEKHPFIDTNFKFVVFFVQFFYISFQLRILGGHILECFLLAIFVTIFYVIFILIGIKKETEKVILILFSLLSSIAFSNLAINLVSDFITFQAYYFSVNSRIVDSILKGSWFTIIEVLTGIELARKGFAPLGAFALMSCQNFQISVLFALIILLNTRNGFNKFILFEDSNSA